MEIQLRELSFVEAGDYVKMLPSPLIPPPNALLEDFDMFRVRHCRVTSLASGMLRMILPGPPTSVGEACPEQSRRALAGVVRRPHSMRPSPPSQRHKAKVILALHLL